MYNDPFHGSGQIQLIKIKEKTTTNIVELKAHLIILIYSIEGYKNAKIFRESDNSLVALSSARSVALTTWYWKSTTTDLVQTHSIDAYGRKWRRLTAPTQTQPRVSLFTSMYVPYVFIPSNVSASLPLLSPPFLFRRVSLYPYFPYLMTDKPRTDLC